MYAFLVSWFLEGYLGRRSNAKICWHLEEPTIQHNLCFIKVWLNFWSKLVKVTTFCIPCPSDNNNSTALSFVNFYCFPYFCLWLENDRGCIKIYFTCASKADLFLYFHFNNETYFKWIYILIISYIPVIS